METKNIQDEEAVQSEITRKLQIGVTAKASAPKYAERTEQLAQETRFWIAENNATLIEGIERGEDVLKPDCDGIIRIEGGAGKTCLGSEIDVIYATDKAEMRKTGQVIFYVDTEDTEYPENQIADVPGERCAIQEEGDTPQKAVELILQRIREALGNIPIGVEITPPQDPAFIGQYSEAAVKILGKGKVSTCFVVGTEPMDSLKQGIEKVVDFDVIPSPLAGRYFEQFTDYPFDPRVNWKDFLEIFRFTREQMLQRGLMSSDKAGCISCGMCDVIGDKEK